MNGRLTQMLGDIRRTTVQASAGVSDAQLLERFARAGDQAAFELLVWRHQGLVLGLCRRVLRDGHAAEDAFQATFLALARKAGNIRKSEALVGWLYRVAYRAALTARARRARQTARERPLAAAEASAAPAGRDLPESKELQAIVDEEMSQLPARFRAAAVMCYLEGKTVEEAARQLGCPRGTVASRLARARRLLRGRLSRRGLGLTAVAAAAIAPAGSAAAAPCALVQAVVRGAAQAGAGLPARVITLTQEVLRAMFYKKLLTGAAVVTVFAGVLFLGGGVALRLHAEAATAAPAQAARDQDNPPAQAAAPARAVTVSHPVQRQAVPFEDFTGHLEAVGQVEVRARANGPLHKIHVKAGAEVKKGDLLFEIAWTRFRAALDQANDNLAQAQSRLKLAEDKLHRFQQLFASGAVDVQVKDEALAYRADAARACSTAEAALKRVRQDLQDTRVIAPIAGMVALPQPPPDTASAGQVLATLTPLDPIGVRFDMDELSLLRYRRALRAQKVKGLGGPLFVGMADEKGYPHKATIDHIDAQVNPATGTITFHGILPNPDGLHLPGMLAQVRMPFGPPRAVLEVADSAVMTDKGQHFVWVVNERNEVQRRLVQLGAQQDGRRIIHAGIRPADWVVTGGAAGLHPGDRVEPRPVALPGKSH